MRHLETVVIFEAQVGVSEGKDTDEENHNAVSNYNGRNGDSLEQEI